MRLAFNWTPFFLTKSHPVNNFAEFVLAKFVESSFIDLMHTIVSGKSLEQKVGNIDWSSNFHCNILLKVSILDA